MLALDVIALVAALLVVAHAPHPEVLVAITLLAGTIVAGANVITRGVMVAVSASASAVEARSRTMVYATGI